MEDILVRGIAACCEGGSANDRTRLTSAEFAEDVGLVHRTIGLGFKRRVVGEQNAERASQPVAA